MPTYNPPLSKAPLPTKTFFDPYNSSSTGHQRAANRLSGSTSWRDSRTYKLRQQFSDRSGRGGERHLADLVGAGSEDFGRDGRKKNGYWEVEASGLRERGWRDVRGLMAGGEGEKRGRVEGGGKREEEGGKMHALKRRRMSEDGKTPRRAEGVDEIESAKETHLLDNVSSTSITSGDDEEADVPPFPFAQPQHPPRSLSSSPSDNPPHPAPSVRAHEPTPTPTPTPPPPIFRNLTIYLNGSTAPLISDHHLKQLFFQHGGSAALSMGRRTVTHVIVGADAAGGGGLAGGKIHKEVRNVRGKGVKFVTAQWVVDSVERGRRLPEGGYVPRGLGGRVAGAGQGSVWGWAGGGGGSGR